MNHNTDLSVNANSSPSTLGNPSHGAAAKLSRTERRKQKAVAQAASPAATQTDRGTQAILEALSNMANRLAAIESRPTQLAANQYQPQDESQVELDLEGDDLQFNDDTALAFQSMPSIAPQPAPQAQPATSNALSFKGPERAAKVGGYTCGAFTGHSMAGGIPLVRILDARHLVGLKTVVNLYNHYFANVKPEVGVVNFQNDMIRLIAAADLNQLPQLPEYDKTKKAAAKNGKAAAKPGKGAMNLG